MYPIPPATDGTVRLTDEHVRSRQAKGTAGSGRQPWALAIYRALCKTLAGDFGQEPWPELRRTSS